LARTGAPLAMGHRWAVGAFVAVTGFIWVQRLVNLAAGEEANAGTSVVLSVVFVASALAAAAGLAVAWRQRWRVSPAVAGVWRVAAALTVAVWVVRATQIILDWRSPAFVAVHVVLALVSLGLAAGLWRAAAVSPPVGTRH
jgi:hypothetical protein